MSARGIEQLYTHQAAAFAHVLAGRNVVTITPTASGKTLCYNAPVLDAILKDPSTRALYLFPTKALAQDQLAELHASCSSRKRTARPEVGVFTYDGDTPSDARRAIRGKAHVVLSNPDMLHSGILPHHPRWAKLFENLHFVVIDELHAYRGVFGSHLANILRRLRRVCRHYGSDPVFICSSATIANPRELAEGLTGRPFELIDQSGAPRGEKFFLFVNPPVVNPELGIRRSYLAEARRVALEFLKHNLQLILFAQSRLATEILTTYLKDAFQGAPGSADVIRGYRGGYLPGRRREIERGLREGAGPSRRVDQRARARHRHRRARRVGDGGLSRDHRRHLATRRTGRPTHDAVGGGARGQQRADRSVHHSQPFVLLRCIARARAHQSRQPAHPARSREVCGVRAAVRGRRAVLSRRPGRSRRCPADSVGAGGGRVRPFADGQWNWTHESYPADAVSLRSVSSDNFVVVDTTHGERVIGETDFTSGPATLHEKAIYLVEGQLFQVEKLDFDGRKAYVRSVDCDYYTDAITYTKVTILETFDSTTEGRGPMADDGLPSSGRTADLDLAPRQSRYVPTARSTSSRASSDSRRSSSTPTRTSGPASSTCRSSRCTRRRTG